MRKSWLIISRVLCAAAILILLPAIVLGNDSAFNDGEHGPMPLIFDANHESPIQMVSEHLDIEFHIDYSRVRVRFIFLNTAETTVSQTLGFPDEFATTKGKEGIRFVGPITEMETYLNGQWAWSEQKTINTNGNIFEPSGTVTDADTGYPMVWWVFTAEFPPGETVTVERRYRVQNGAGAGYTNQWFRYTTLTGSPWHGPIEKLVADVRLAGGISTDDLYFSGIPEALTCWPTRDNWEFLSSTHMRLTWTDFEPALEPERQSVRIVTIGFNESFLELLGRGAPLLTYARIGGPEWPLSQSLDPASINVQDSHGWSPLMLALDHSHTDIAKMIIDAGADINLPSQTEITPLMLAVERGDIDMVRYLLQRGVAVSRRDKAGLTALDYATKYQRDEIIQLLKQRQ